MIRCSDGHFYDSEKHSSCPICGVSGLNIGGATKGRYQAPPRKPVPKDAARDAGKTHGPKTPPKPKGGHPKTVGFWGKKLDPVVGWLVCIEGPDKGRDYRIRSEKNFIGRSPEMDIFVENDEQISRKKHAAVTYNPRNNKFKLLPGDGRALVYLNDDDVETPRELNAHDLLEIGKSKFIFIPLCGEQFQWDVKEKEKETGKEK
ncbi:MAG: FHA domain-containing protein [bacterium]|nr:FHA domain-containing protein [bacterium]